MRRPGKWGIRINRVEIKIRWSGARRHQGIDGEADARRARSPRRDPDRRAPSQAAILTAEGEQRAAVLTAEGARQAAILRAEGEAKAIATVFAAIHAGDPDQQLLSYQYLQMLPEAGLRVRRTRCSSKG